MRAALAAGILVALIFPASGQVRIEGQDQGTNCVAMMREAVTNLNLVGAMMQSFNPDTPVKIWCEEMHRRYTVLEDMPAVVNRCMPADHERDAILHLAETTRDEAHADMNKRCL